MSETGKITFTLAYSDGYWAKVTYDVAADKNPYDPRTQPWSHSEWLQGWSAAQSHPTTSPAEPVSFEEASTEIKQVEQDKLLDKALGGQALLPPPETSKKSSSTKKRKQS